MKKLLLTSDGFTNPNIGKRFLELVGKKPRDVRVLFVPTASQTEHEMSYVYKSEKDLIDIGILKENIVWANALENIEIKDYDAMYICGGNTFYLTSEIRRTGFDKKIMEFINLGKVYVGVSAGSIIMCPTILHAKNFDKNYIGLKDMTGFNLTDKIIEPHHKIEEEEIVKKFEEENKCQILRLPDGQALEIVGDVSKIIQ